MGKPGKQLLIILIFVMGICGGVLVVSVYHGFLWPNSYFAAQYHVRGIDISAYQGMINWEAVAQNKELCFVFIKSSEGMDYQDSFFKRNWDEAKKHEMLRGAYHYFKISSSGSAQARNFISIVPYEKGDLPPVVDIEEEGLAKEQFIRELKTFLGEIESFYGKKPIIYVTYPMYDKYISNEFADYPIWIRDVAWTPRLGNNRAWEFWQYCNRGRVKGIDTFVDIDVYAKDYQSLRKLASD